MARVTIYVKHGDPHSTRLLTFLKTKDVSFFTRWVDEDPDFYQEMMEKTGEMDTPQLVIGDEHIGDYEDVTSLDLRGKFDELLEQD